MFFIPINIPTFCFSPKKFLQLLISKIFNHYCWFLFLSKFLYFFNEVVHKHKEYCKKSLQKKLEFVNKT